MISLYYRLKRLKRYVEARVWIFRKRKEIIKHQKEIQKQLHLFKEETYLYGTLARDGTTDLNVMKMYKLKGNGMVEFGTSVRNLDKLNLSLLKAELTLSRFEEKIRKEGWWNDNTAINKALRELYIQKQEAVTTRRTGISFYKSALSIPD